MEDKERPSYAVFDDHRYSQQVVVLVRWFVLGAWLFVINYIPDVGRTLVILDSMGGALAVLNGYVHWRIWRGRPIPAGYVLALSVMDLAIITAGIGATTRFGNTFFVFYYPALLGLSLVFSSRRLSFGVATVVTVSYVTLSYALEPGVDHSIGEDKTMIVRVVAMFAVVAAGNLLTRIERRRRRQAADAERAQSERNLQLQRKAMEAEMAAQAERHRIGRDIHDGIAQSIYALSLNLETCAELAERESSPLHEHLQKLVPLAKETLLETRHYIYDLKPLLSGDSDLSTLAASQVKEFRTVAGIPAELSTDGEPSGVSVAVATGLYRVLQESLANVLKHARASRVDVALAFENDAVGLTVRDDGVGFRPDGVTPGHGLQNMRHRAEELGGRFDISSSPGDGTSISVKLPNQEVQGGQDQGDDRGRPRGGASGPEDGT